VGGLVRWGRQGGVARARRALWQGSGLAGKGRVLRRPGHRAERQDSPRAAAAGGRAPSSSSGGSSSSSSSAGLGVISLVGPGAGARSLSAGLGAAQGPGRRPARPGVRPPSAPRSRRRKRGWKKLCVSKADKGFTLITSRPRRPLSKHRLDSWRL
jgi:hypothetical protein